MYLHNTSIHLFLYWRTGDIWLLLIGITAWLIFRKKKKEVPLPDGFIAITDDIIFHEKDGILKYKEGDEIILTTYKLKLFTLLLNEIGHFIPVDIIKDTVWADGMSTKDALVQAIRRLRNELEPFPELRIENARDKGYRLLTGNKVIKESQ
ncbi:hypothetical protein DW095_06825 [Bacteroides sp. AM07-16]|uniref:winged helix-turn-helix domain-containing protein n=1 Tax=Parabacteroides bouchesdurhonensis TaxID=1936995 RepID=UPI000E46FD95|nr:hypothetical protein DW095_06825 [Bacteroides sp. AM07-16]